MPNWSKSLVHILRFRKLKIRENQQILVIDLAAQQHCTGHCVITEPLPSYWWLTPAAPWVPGWLSPARVSAVIPLSLSGAESSILFFLRPGQSWAWQQSSAPRLLAARAPARSLPGRYLHTVTPRQWAKLHRVHGGHVTTICDCIEHC